LAVYSVRSSDFSRSASHLFDRKHEIHSAVFGNLRKGIRRIVTRLSEGMKAIPKNFADGLRILLSEMADCSNLLLMGAAGNQYLHSEDASTVEMRWGREIRAAYDSHAGRTCAIQQAENPARTQLRDIIRQLRLQGRDWRIYCHRRARAHFESIFQMSH